LTILKKNALRSFLCVACVASSVGQNLKKKR